MPIQNQRVPQIFACGSEQQSGHDAEGEKEDGVLGHQAKADEAPTPRHQRASSGLQQGDDRGGGEYPPQVVKAGVLELRALKERVGAERDGHGRGELRQAASAKAMRHPCRAKIAATCATTLAMRRAMMFRPKSSSPMR